MRYRILVGWACALCGGFAFAEPDLRDGPVLVELFTSQSCYSCPPAEAYLGELIRERPEVLALEFHVDYWNDLVYGAAGNWRDVHSRAEYTARQRAYNRARLRGRAGVYTPQMVIGGKYVAVGSRRNDVERGIRKLQQEPAPLRLAAAMRGGALAVEVDGQARAGAGVWLALFDRQHTTRVAAGENHGKSLTNYHVVTELRRIGEWGGQAQSISVPGVQRGANQGCAVFVQGDALGAILGAAACTQDGGAAGGVAD